MVHEHSIRAALAAEAGLARVPTEEILKRIRKAEAAPRRFRFWAGLRFSQIAEVVAICAVLALLLMLPFQRAAKAPASAPAPAPVPAGDAPANGATPRLYVYENQQLGVAVAEPGTRDMPLVDAQGRLIVNFDGGQIAISHEVRQSQQDLAELLKEEAAIRADLGTPLETGERSVSGHPAAFLRFRDRDVYVVPVDGSQYTLECAAAGAPWAKVQPACDRLLALMNLGAKVVVTPSGAQAVTRDGNTILSIVIDPDTGK